MPISREKTKLLWRIDSWDSLGGRAFLCHRFPDDDEAPALDHPSIFVAPPFFQPEPVASRAPGLAAAREYFQSGFFLEGEEVGFVALDDAIAFIRRGYDSHGPEPLTGGPTPPTAGPEGGGVPDLPIPGAPEELAANKEIDRLVKGYIELSATVRVRESQAEPANWSLSQHAIDEASYLLQPAGVALVIEMLRRVPVAGTPEQFLEWAAPAASLGQNLQRVGLWPEIAVAVSSKLGEKTYNALFNLLGEQPGYNGRDKKIEVLCRLFCPASILHNVNDRDLYRELSTFPLPRSLGEKYSVHAVADPNMLSLLSVWLGSPLRVEQSDSLDHSLLLLAGAFVVEHSRGDQRNASRGWWYEDSPVIRQALLKRTARDAWKWIQGQLPSRVFDIGLEEALARISGIWTQYEILAASGNLEEITPNALDSDEEKSIITDLSDLLDDADPSSEAAPPLSSA